MHDTMFYYKMSMQLGIVLYSIAAILHSVGFYFLKRFKADSLCSSTQRICLLNLCFVELLFSVNGIVIRIDLLVESKQLNRPYEFFQFGFLNQWYISVMVLLTFDRFLSVYLNIKYHL